MTDDYDWHISIQGAGDAVVLVPGMDGTGRPSYCQQPLLASSHRVATYALRDAARSMDVLVADLARVIETVAPVEGRAVVIGESFGGTLAMSLALERPLRTYGVPKKNERDGSVIQPPLGPSPSTLPD